MILSEEGAKVVRAVLIVAQTVVVGSAHAWHSIDKHDIVHAKDRKILA